MSSKDRRIRYCALHLLNIVDEEEGRERQYRVNTADDYLSAEVNVFDLTHTYRGPTLYGMCIGEGCYWNHWRQDINRRERG